MKDLLGEHVFVYTEEGMVTGTVTGASGNDGEIYYHVDGKDYKKRYVFSTKEELLERFPGIPLDITQDSVIEKFTDLVGLAGDFSIYLSWSPTAHLRYVNRDKGKDLQQLWQSNTGNQEWRDIQIWDED
ncbi:MAG: hypothetical protein F6K19_01585 [Cyanothece sp. SIO1E1]|nr:hypothetical protein [Cyanothece sp. SIO1E1]